MQVGNKEFFYISCQGPLPATVSAFWQMIWESKSDVIAMMTQEVERGRIKCHKYWPEKLGIPQDTGRYLLHLENRQNLEYFQIKIIRMVETEVRTLISKISDRVLANHQWKVFSIGFRVINHFPFSRDKTRKQLVLAALKSP